MKETETQPSAETGENPEQPVARKPPKPFDPNIDGAVVRLHLGTGQVLFCDIVLITERDLVVAISKSEAIPDRGVSVQCSLFLIEDDSYVSHREGVVHWEMALHGRRLAGIFLSEAAPTELLELTSDDRRREIRYPANLGCRISNKTDSQAGRLVNYSLNGLATQLPQPLTIGENYTIEVDAGDEDIKLEATCRWNIETSYGYVNGCSFSNGEGKLLAQRAFRGSVMPWDLNRNRGQSATVDEEMATPLVSTIAELPVVKPVISNTTILLLSATLLGLSIRTPDHIAEIAFFAGLVGLVTYIGLAWTARMREAVKRNLTAKSKQDAAESRLAAHVTVSNNKPNRGSNAD